MEEDIANMWLDASPLPVSTLLPNTIERLIQYLGSFVDQEVGCPSMETGTGVDSRIM
jgi:hypothetical protein